MRDLAPHNTFVEPKHGPNPALLLVGEAPGAEEAAAGEPFVGGAGRLLRGVRQSGGLLGRAGIPESDVTIVNTVQCRPPNNVYPADPKADYLDETRRQQAIQHCLRAHVLPLIQTRNWHAIVALGAHAFRAMTSSPLGITEARGFRFDCRWKPGTPVYPVLHPAAILRDMSEAPTAVNDLAKAYLCHPHQESLNSRPSPADVLALCGSHPVAVDIETGTNGEITHIGLSTAPGTGLCMPATPSYLKLASRVLHEATALIGHNLLGFDYPRLRKAGLVKDRYDQYWDTMLMHHLRHPDLPHSLSYAVSTYLDVPPWKSEMEADIALYCARDVCRTMGLFHKLCGQFDVYPNLLRLYQDTSVPLAYLCREMTEQGLYADPLAMDVARKELLRRRDALAASLPPEIAPVVENIRHRVASAQPGRKWELVPSQKVRAPYRSVKVLSRYLYETLGLPVQRNLDTGNPSTGKVALLHLRARARTPEQRELIDTLEELRSIEVQLANFLSADRAGRQHPQFLVHGTATGRLSSSGPNVQNIPSVLRKVYAPRDGYVFVEIDFSSLENRLTAWYAKDAERLKRFEDRSFNEHKFMAAQLFGVPYEQIPKDKSRYSMYTKAKIVVHGCVTSGHQVLTRSGWVPIESWSGQDIAVWNPTTSEIRFEAPSAYHVYQYSGPIHILHGRSGSIEATPDHGLARVLRSNYKAKKYWRIERAEIASLRAEDYVATSGMLASTCVFDDLEVTPEQRELFLSELLHWDGTSRFACTYLTTNYNNAVWVQTIAHLSGRQALMRCFVRGHDRKPLYRVSINKRKNMSVGSAERSVYQYSGNVYCFTTSTGYFMIRHRDRVMVSGNSNYLMGARKIAWTYGLQEREVRDMLARLYQQFPATKRWQERIVEAAKRGPLTNAYGRMRWFWTSTSSTEAVAFLPQSTGADVCFETMIRLFWDRTPMTAKRARELWGDDIEPLPKDVYLVCQVHDSLLFEVPRDRAETVLKRIVQVAEQPRRALAGLVLPVEGRILERWE